GDAAETSATSGNKWRVHFAPDEIGEWQFSVAFRKGSNIVVSDDRLAGESAGHMDGMHGIFSVKPSDKTGRDLRAKGRLQYVDKPYLQFAETAEFFLKAGADAPENLLAYADFDGDFKSDGHKDDLVKTWEPHIGDWENGDPSWQNGKGKGLIGAVNYLASKGMNAFSFLPMNIAGDDQNVFPYTSYDIYDRMDLSKLDQWEILFEHADRQGMFLHFKTSEAENQGLLDNGDLGVQRKLYYRELISRFSHHLALNWNIGEENGKWLQEHPTPWQNTTQRLACAQYFHDHDPYQHHIVIHNGQQFHDLLGPESKYTGLSIQTNREDFANVHREVLRWRALAKAAGKNWANAVDEPGDHRYAVVPDNVNPDHDNARQNALWGALMGGAWGVEWYFGYLHPESDLSLQSWRSRENMWTQSQYALRFFMENDIPFWDMEPIDDLTSDENDYVLGRSGDMYVIYQKIGHKESIVLPGLHGEFTVSWYNPRTGEFTGDEETLVASGNLSIGLPPAETDMDWTVLVRKHFSSIYNGTNFDGWYLYLRDRPIDEDPKKVFQIRPNGSIHVSGEEFGYLMTEKIYQDFYLKLEFKWGEKKWPPRLDQRRDSGICYHVPDGTTDMIWPKSLECQIQEGDVGDIWLIDSTTVQMTNGQFTRPGNFQRVVKQRDAEKPNGEWNTVEVVSIDGHNRHIVNGVLVNESFKGSEHEGRILIQSEGAEIFYRNIEIKEL
ncbi:MAG: DUF1080 domain-containing protein, partial [Saprospiraceae bacterium]|nr:DUF1080 domain-containing protein [Saprospiraceae bacterium]